jgi:hypothetical protein
MKIQDFINDIKLESLNKPLLLHAIKDVNFIDASLPYRIYGIALWDKILFDSEQIKWLSEEKKLFFVLHELCHHLRFQKTNKEEFFRVFASDDLDELADSVIKEEIIADKYACFTFYKLTGNTFDKQFTQKLEQEENRLRYKDLVKNFMFKKFKNEEDYIKYVNSIHKER